PLSTEDRRLALLALAEIRLGSLRDADAAEQAARVALGLKRTSVAAAMLLAEACFAQGKQTEGILARERVVDAWQDSAARAIVLVDIARIIERQGHSKRAHQYYSRAAEVDSNALDAHLGMARTARGLGDAATAIAALERAATLLQSNRARHAFHYVAAR